MLHGDLISIRFDQNRNGQTGKGQKSCLQIPTCQTSFHFYGIRDESLSSVTSC